jgi:hypothetical protein
MHHQCSLPLQFEFCDKEGQSRRSIGALNRDSQKSGRFVENDHGIVFVKDGKLAGETRPAPVFMGRNSIRLSPMAARLSRMFLHWLGTDDHRYYQTIPPTSQTRRSQSLPLDLICEKRIGEMKDAISADRGRWPNC